MGSKMLRMIDLRFTKIYVLFYFIKTFTDVPLYQVEYLTEY